MFKSFLFPALLSCISSLAFADTIKLDMGNGKQTFTVRDAHAISALHSYSSLQKSWSSIEPLLITRFARLDPEGDGYKIIDQNKRQLVSEARRRAGSIQKWLIYDLDGDGQVTESELEQIASQPMQVRTTSGNVQIIPTVEQQQQILDQIKRVSKLPDPNKDGITEFSEMLEAAKKQKNTRVFNAIARNQISFEFDTNDDGTVTQTEFLQNHKDVFAMFDKNSDQTIDLTELKQLREAQRSTRELLRR